MSDALDTLCELLARFGGLLPAEQMARVQALALGYLGESKAALRKKAMHCLGEGWGGAGPGPGRVGQRRYTIIRGPTTYPSIAPPPSPAAASVHLPDPLLDEAVTQLQAQLSAPKGQLRADVVRIYVQAVGQVR